MTGRRAGALLWWRRNPSACPYNQRFWVEAPHPRPGGRLVVGEIVLDPHTGHYY